MRYLPLPDGDRAEMRAAIGVDDIDALFKDVPESARLTELLDLPLHSGEIEVERALEAMAAVYGLTPRLARQAQARSLTM